MGDAEGDQRHSMELYTNRVQETPAPILGSCLALSSRPHLNVPRVPTFRIRAEQRGLRAVVLDRTTSEAQKLPTNGSHDCSI